VRPVLETILPWGEQGITFIGDPHTFKNETLTQQLKEDLEDAKKRNDLIALWGDVAEWIVPSDLKRYSAKDNHEVDGIVNYEVDRLRDFYAPYVNNIAIMKVGNHETQFIKRHHVDPMAMLIRDLNRLRDQSLQPIFYGGYTCWWLVKMIQYYNEKRVGSQSVKFWLHHGSGGSAPVTRGAIDRARIADSISADVYVIGHKHQSVHINTKHEYLDDYGNVKRKDRDFLIVAGYSGWEQEAPGDNPYALNWSAESFYGLESTGSATIRLTPTREGMIRDVSRRSR
jgi:predicted phosphodiesterase